MRKRYIHKVISYYVKKEGIRKTIHFVELKESFVRSFFNAKLMLIERFRKLVLHLQLKSYFI